MNEERMQILRMLEEGKIQADEAYQLIVALEESKPATSIPGRFLRVRVHDPGGTKVNVNIPIRLARLALRFVPRRVMAEHPELDLDELIREIDAGAAGKLVEIDDEGTHVEVTVE